MNCLQTVLPFWDSFPSVYMWLSGASAPMRTAPVDVGNLTGVWLKEFGLTI